MSVRDKCPPPKGGSSSFRFAKPQLKLKSLQDFQSDHKGCKKAEICFPKGEMCLLSVDTPKGGTANLPSPPKGGAYSLNFYRGHGWNNSPQH